MAAWTGRISGLAMTCAGLALIAACSSESDTPPGSGPTSSSNGGMTSSTVSGTGGMVSSSSGMGGNGGASSTGSGGMAPCNNFSNEGPDVMKIQIASDPPAATGGSIELGVYYLTAFVIHTGNGGMMGITGDTRKETLVIVGNGMEGVASDNGGLEEHTSSAYTLPGGAAIDISTTCPSNTIAQLEYTATSTVLQLFDGNRLATFQKQ